MKLKARREGDCHIARVVLRCNCSTVSVRCRHLLSTWDAQHPDPGTAFVWTGRNIAAIAAACVVNKATCVLSATGLIPHRKVVSPSVLACVLR